jgi:hypothetical protein
VRELAAAWVPHTRIEEEILLPEVEAKATDAAFGEAQVCRDLAKILLADLLRGGDDEYFDAKLAVLGREIGQLIELEERPKTGLLALAASGGVDMKALGSSIESRSAEFQADAEDDVKPPKPHSLRYPGFGRGWNPKERDTMARHMDMPERDERGRFVSDDDDDYRGRGRRSSRASGRERDEYGRFMSDDDDDRGNGRRSSGASGRERDEYGRFVSDDDDDRGNGRRMSSRRSRDYDDDDDRYSRDRGQGGWLGDPEGHS